MTIVTNNDIISCISKGKAYITFNTNAKNNYIKGEIRMDNKTIVFDAVYRMSSAIDTLKTLGKLEDLGMFLLKNGYTNEQRKGIDLFIENNLPKEEYTQYVIQESILKYTKALSDAKDIMISQMERGYQEMGNINLQIAEEHAQMIDEGVNVYEMGTKESQTGS